MSSAVLSDRLGPIRGNPAGSAILLDVDGTLAPIVEHPADARVPDDTRRLLLEISRRYAVVACVTGRRAADARAMVSIETISYLGSHGAELLRPGTNEPVIDPNVEDWERRVQEFGRAADSPDLRSRGVRLEEKGAIVAFHWRGAPDERAARAAIDGLAGKAEAAGLRTQRGRKVLEVRPPVRIDKGAGIASFLEHSDVEAAVYIGDDVTDLDAFHALSGLVDEGCLVRAIRVGVRSDEGPSEIADEADIVVEGTRGVQKLLALLAGA